MDTEPVPPKIYSYLFFTPTDLIEFVQDVFEFEMFLEIVFVEFLDDSVAELPPIFKDGICRINYASFCEYYTELDDVDREIVNTYNIYVDRYNSDFSKIVNELYLGTYDSMEEYVRQFYEDVYYTELNAIPSLLRDSIDWEYVAKEFEQDTAYYFIKQTGHLFSGD